jgi:hypothetical protein
MVIEFHCGDSDPNESPLKGDSPLIPIYPGNKESIDAEPVLQSMNGSNLELLNSLPGKT